MKLSTLKDKLFNGDGLRGIIAIAIFVVIWETGARSEQWFGFRFPFLGLVPPPTDVFTSWAGLIGDSSYWQSWYMSFLRVFGGFTAAVISLFIFKSIKPFT